MLIEFVGRDRALNLIAGTVFAILLTNANAAFGAERGGQPRVFTPEEVAKERPQGKVTVAFRVQSVGRLIGDSGEVKQAEMPLQLMARAKMKHTKDNFHVMLVGSALAPVQQLGMKSPADHFRGKEVWATGTIRYLKLPRITRPDGSTKIGQDNWTHYVMVVD